MEDHNEPSDDHKSSGITFGEAIAAERAELAEAERSERAAIKAGEAAEAEHWRAQAHQCRQMIAHLERAKAERDANDVAAGSHASAPAKRAPLDTKWKAALEAIKDRKRRGVELELVKAMRTRTRSKAILDYGGVIARAAGPGYEPPKEIETSTRTKAALNVARFEWLLRNEHVSERVDRATRAIERAVQVFLLPERRGEAEDAREIVVLLEFIQFRHPKLTARDAAKCLRAHCAFDTDGLGKIPKGAWQKALKQWRGRWRSREGTRGGRPKAGDYDFRSIVLELLEYVKPGSRASRQDAMRWLNDLMGAETPLRRNPPRNRGT